MSFCVCVFLCACVPVCLCVPMCCPGADSVVSRMLRDFMGQAGGSGFILAKQLALHCQTVRCLRKLASVGRMRLPRNPSALAR